MNGKQLEAIKKASVSVDAVYGELKEKARGREDILLPFAEIVTQEGKLALLGRELLPMNKTAFRQLMSRLGVSKGWKYLYEDIMPYENGKLVDAHVNRLSADIERTSTYGRGRRAKNAKKGPRIARLRTDINPDTLISEAYAIVTKDYGVFDNHQVTGILKKINERGGDLSIFRPFLESTRMSLRVYDPTRVVENPNGGQMLPGVYLSGRDDGTAAIAVRPAAVVTVCSNGLIGYRADGEKYRFVHMHDNSSLSIASMEYEITKAIGRSLRLSEETIKEYLGAMHIPVDALENLLEGIVNRTMPKEKRTAGLLLAKQGVSSGSTVASLVEGLTFAAHTAELSQDDQDNLEAVAGRILFEASNNPRSNKAMATAFFSIANREKVIVEIE